MSILLQVRNVTKMYENQTTPGLENVSFDVEEGEFLASFTAYF